MEIRNTIILSESYYEPVGAYSSSYSISSKPLDVLLANLATEKVVIDPQCSEKTVDYKFQARNDGSAPYDSMTTKKSDVPLQTVFSGIADHLVQVRAFYLRDGVGLELKLTNYENTTSRPEEGMIGGMEGGDSGIQCDVTLVTRKFDSTLFDRIESALRNTYCPVPRRLDISTDFTDDVLGVLNIDADIEGDSEERKDIRRKLGRKPVEARRKVGGMEDRSHTRRKMD